MANHLREIILNTKKPIIIKNYDISWKCLKQPLTEWTKGFDELYDFETSKLNHFDEPQWEKNRNKIKMSLNDFLQKFNSDVEYDQSNWAALSYRSIRNLPETLKEDIKFTEFGFPEIDDNDSTFWLSSKGAHTPCHYDTYGCNIVVQVYGRKLWLLFPPSSNLTPTRIPYEESSVYCMENFYSPSDFQQFENIQSDCYSCILEPGNILVIPKNWWHYVENLETSLSINHWIPIESDIESQMDECIVKYLIEKFVQQSDNDIIKLNILNPNQLTEICQDSELIKIIDFLAKKLTEKLEDKSKKLSTLQKHYPYQYLSDVEIKILFERSKFKLELVKSISNEEFILQMKTNSKRFEECIQDRNDDNLIIKKILINSICNPNIIVNIRKLFLRNYLKIH